jgi:hypothetical protein
MSAFDKSMAEAIMLIREIDPGDVFGVAFNFFGEKSWQALAWGWDTQGNAVYTTGESPTEALGNMVKRLRIEKTLPTSEQRQPPIGGFPRLIAGQLTELRRARRKR